MIIQLSELVMCRNTLLTVNHAFLESDVVSMCFLFFCPLDSYLSYSYILHKLGVVNHRVKSINSCSEL